MWRYCISKLLYTFLILIGVNILTFALFFSINSPEDMARMHLGQKYVSQSSIDAWKHQRGYDLPLFWNAEQSGLQKLTSTLFFNQSIHLFQFKFGISDLGRQINDDILQRMGPSLSITVPSLILGLIIHISIALLLVFFRYTWFFQFFDILCVILLSISSMFVIIAGQYWFAVKWRWAPISGYQPGLESIRFLVLPISLYILLTLGPNIRWYRSLFIEEIDKDYVRLARAKGLSELRILFNHVLPNGLLPILTNVVVVIPSLFMGSLLLESFFCIPGLGSYTINAINQQDFAIVRVMVFLGTLLYLMGLFLTDITYSWVDPRIRLSA